MPTDVKFDPETHDLISDGKGSFVMTETAETMVMHQIICHYNEWWGDETLGSELWNLNNFQADPEASVPDEMKRALGVIVARGRISNLQVIAEVPQPGRVVAASTFRDVSTGQVATTYAKAGGR